MERENNHIRIDSVAWDILVRNQEQAESWQQLASQFTRENMLPFMEQALAGENSEGQLLRIDKLEMEFRHVNNLEDLEQAFKSSFREAWRKANTNRSTLNTGQDKGRSISLADPLEQFKFFLEYGFLEWETDKQFIDDPSLLFHLLDQSPPAKFRDWIMSIGMNTNAVTRFIDYFTTGQLKLIYSKYNPAASLFENGESFFKILFDKASHTHLNAMGARTLLRLLIFYPDTDLAFIIRQWWKDLTLSPAEKERMEQEIQAWDLSRTLDLTEQGLVFINELQSMVEPGKKNVPIKNLAIDNASLPISGSRILEARAHFIENVGLILLYPYIKQFLRENSLIDENGDFRNAEDQMQSCYLLQYIISGDPQVKEYHLLLNKVLLGYPTEMAVTRTWNPDKADPEAAKSFLRKVLKNWPKLETTSVEGFRTSFLLRQGKLVEESNNWILYVERKGWDVLLDNLPYPITIIKLPWMIKPLYVQW